MSAVRFRPWALDLRGGKRIDRPVRLGALNPCAAGRRQPVTEPAKANAVIQTTRETRTSPRLRSLRACGNSKREARLDRGPGGPRIRFQRSSSQRCAAWIATGARATSQWLARRCDHDGLICASCAVCHSAAPTFDRSTEWLFRALECLVPFLHHAARPQDERTIPDDARSPSFAFYRVRRLRGACAVGAVERCVSHGGHDEGSA